MSECVLDGSATVPWALESEATPDPDGWLNNRSEGGKAWVPALWHLELANGLLGAQQRGRIDKAGIEKFLSSLDVYDIEVDSERMVLARSKTLALAEGFGLSACDASYFEFALRRGLPLANLDKSLRAAIQRAGGRLSP